MGIKKRQDTRRTALPRVLRPFQVPAGLPPLPLLRAEVNDMWDVLTGRKEPPYWNGTLTLMEVADAYFSRASELTAMIQEGEHAKQLNPSYKAYRTGPLRTFMEAAKRAADLGSRRLTLEQMMFEQEKLGRESA